MINEKIVIVLGMHRSGTSVITNILSKAGFFVGEESDLIKGNQWNRDGYFERWPILKVNELILHLCGGSWHSPPKESDIFRIRIDPQIESILKVYEIHKRSIIKDPRMCLTFPVWQRIFDDRIRIIKITRNPDAIAASLMKRDGFTMEKSFYLWHIYNERASKYAKDYPVYSMKYEDLFSGRRQAILKGLSLFLEIETDLERIAALVVDGSSRHKLVSKTPTEINLEPQPEYERAHQFINDGKNEEAIATLEKLLDSYPDHALAYNDLGVLYYKNSGLVKANLTDTQPWWGYPRFRQEKVRVLLVSLRHLLLSEISGGLERLGHSCKVLLIGGEELDRGTVEQMFTEAIKNFQPDFVLTINHLGFDQEGVVTGLLTRGRIPFASWYVDSPHLIIHHYAQNKSPYLTLFLWDKDYLEIATKLGFEKVEYLPLGVDERLFRPLGAGKNPFSQLSSKVSFVGNSMVIKVRSVLDRCKINGSLLNNFREVSHAFEKSHHLVVRDMMANLFPDLAGELKKLSEPQAFGYETGVTWQATGWYRAELVKKLKPFEPLVVGDAGWGEILNDGFRLQRELNYYSDLPAFYNVTKVSFNATSRQMKNGVNQRVFDAPACQSVVITDWTRQLEDLMEPGREVLAYRSGDEIPELVNRAIKDQEFRRRIAEAGYKRVLSEHTYCHRLKKLINVMKRNYG